MFALIMMEDGTYNICDLKNVFLKKKNKTCIIKYEQEPPQKARLVACNANYEALIEIKKSLNVGSPKIQMTDVLNTSGTNNDSTNLENSWIPVSSPSAYFVENENRVCRNERELRNASPQMAKKESPKTESPTLESSTNTSCAPSNQEDLDDMQKEVCRENNGGPILHETVSAYTIIPQDPNGSASVVYDQFLPLEIFGDDNLHVPLALISNEIIETAPNEIIAMAPNEIIVMAPNEITAAAPYEIIATAPNEIIATAPNKIIAMAPNEIIAAAPDEIIATAPNEIIAEDVHIRELSKEQTMECHQDANNFSDDNSNDSDWEPNADQFSVNRDSDDDSGRDAGGDSEISGKRTPHSRNKSLKNTSTNLQRLSLSFTANCPGKSSCDDENMIVQSSRGASGKGKLHCCFFCHKKQTKIARHLEKMHGDESRVQAFTLLPKKCAERVELITKLRHDGDFMFNVDPELNDGERIVARRPRREFNKTASDFIFCSKCKGSYSNNTVRIHFRKCTGLSSQENRLVTLSSKQIAGRVHSSATESVRRRIIPVMREDDVTKVIRYDALIIGFANKQCKKYRSEHFDKMIRQRLRMLGRLLLTIRKCNENVTDFSSIFDPEIYDATICAVNLVSGLNEETNEYDAPSTASLLGTLLKQIAQTHMSECIKKKRPDKLKDAQNYMQLFEDDFGISVNKTVNENQAQMQRRKNVVIPSMSDIKKLHDYLTRERTKAAENLKMGFSMASWRYLGETTLSSVQLFNRRRAGEVERILIDDFLTHKGIDMNIDKDLYDSLSEEAKSTTSRYVRFEIRGKLNRSVPVLLSSKILECIQLFLDHRREAHVRPSNPYLFGVPSINTVGNKHLDACLLMRKFSTECGAENPASLRGTELRKHMATKCLSLNLNEVDVGEVANFMGHSTDIHKNVYRQTIVSREISKMSRLLEKAQGREYDSEQGNQCDEEDENDTNNEQADTSHEKSDYKTSRISRPLEKCPSKNTNERKRIHSGEKKSVPEKKRRSSSPHGSVKRVPWTLLEKDTILNQYGAYMSADSTTFPSLKTIAAFIKENPVLKARTAQQVKTWMSNQKQVNKKLEYA